MATLTYGRSATGFYAVAFPGDRVWRATEATGEFYAPIAFDAIPECDWDRVDALEELADRAEAR